LQTVVEWAKQIAPALQYLQGRETPIVHRDLTPDNLILRSSGTLMLIDFGAAKEIVGNFTGTIIGKQAYIAPHQFTHKPTPKSDIYSLGATMFFLLTGKQPEPLSPSNPRDHNSRVPQELSELISRCTDQDETTRPDCHQLLQELNELPALKVG